MTKKSSTLKETAAAAKSRFLAARALSSGRLEEMRLRRLNQGDACWRIIQYRRIVEPKDFPLPLKLGSFVTPETFEKHLSYLAEHCNPIALTDLAKLLLNYETVPDKSVAVTFDGAHMDVLLNAVPLLLKFKVPATIFIPTAYPDSGSFFYEDRIAIALLMLKTIKLPLPDFSFFDDKFRDEMANVSPNFEVNDQSVGSFLSALRRVGMPERLLALDILGEMLQGVIELPDHEDFMRWMDLTELSHLGFNFGTQGHMGLTADCFSLQEFVEDFGESFNTFKQNGLPLQKFYCFPEGIVTKTALDVLTKLNVPFALTLSPEPLPQFQNSYPLLLGRTSMNEENAAHRETFACRLWNIELDGHQY